MSLKKFSFKKLKRTTSESKADIRDDENYIQECIDRSLSVIKVQLSECVKSLVGLERNVIFIKDKLNEIEERLPPQYENTKESCYMPMSNKYEQDVPNVYSSSPKKQTIEIPIIYPTVPMSRKNSLMQMEETIKSRLVKGSQENISRKESKKDLLEVENKIIQAIQNSTLRRPLNRNIKEDVGGEIKQLAVLPPCLEHTLTNSRSGSRANIFDNSTQQIAMLERNNSNEHYENDEDYLSSSTIYDHSPLTQSNESIAYGRCDFNRPDCVKITKNDKLEILEKPNDQFLLVKNVRTGEQGYVPRDLLYYEKSLESEEWFYGNASRLEVTSALLTEVDPDGTYLVRRTDKNHPYVLSVKVSEGGKCAVKHYRIFRSKKNEFFISPGIPFVTLGKLIESYTYNNHQICCKLSNPCKKKPQPVVSELSPLYSLSWEIPSSEVVIEEQIGGGQFSKVFKGKWKTKVVAIKKVDIDHKNDVINEINIMKTLRHKNVTLILGFCGDPPNLIIEEFLDKGSLKTFLKTDLPMRDLTYISFQIADGMDYLATRNIIHRDLAARNILVGEDLTIKISDFGLSRVHKPNQNYIMKNEIPIPVKWAAPELIYENEHSTKVDVWSFGVVVVEIFTKGDDPYPNMTPKEVGTKVAAGYRMAKPDIMPLTIYDSVCVPCWEEKPKDRPDFVKLKFFFDDLEC